MPVGSSPNSSTPTSIRTHRRSDGTSGRGEPGGEESDGDGVWYGTRATTNDDASREKAWLEGIENDGIVGGGGTGSGGRQRSRLARVWRAAKKAADA